MAKRALTENEKAMAEVWKIKAKCYALLETMRDAPEASATLPGRKLVMDAADKLAEAWRALRDINAGVVVSTER